jgi:hypothetical protein
MASSSSKQHIRTSSTQAWRAWFWSGRTLPSKHSNSSLRFRREREREGGGVTVEGRGGGGNVMEMELCARSMSKERDSKREGGGTCW